MIGHTHRRTIAAYAAGLAAIGGLMAIVALGGTAVGPKNTTPTFSAAQVLPGN